MSVNSTAESPSSPSLRRSSNDMLLKPITLLDAQTEKALSKLTIPKVLVLYTGGTIGMKVLRNAYEPAAHFLVSALRGMNIMHDITFEETMKEIDPEKSFLYLPLANEEWIAYYIKEYTPLLDSANMTYDNYIQIALDIKEVYNLFNGFVILHGTDTMSYTAAALSFIFENLSKPVVLTGSQIPIFETRSDGRDNLIGSLLLAGQYLIPEVTLYFRNRLYRGNRVTKIDSEGLNAFYSHNFPTLAEFRTKVEVKWDLVFDRSSEGPFNVHTNLNRNVSLLRLFPGITYLTMRQFLEPPIQGVVLQTYGAGNLPTNRPDLIEELRKASERGVLIVNCTQCAKGSVHYIYEAATALQKIGVCSGLDMTIEAALMKLSYILGKYSSDKKVMKMKMAENLRGEMSADSTKVTCPKINLNWILNATNDETNEESVHFRQSLIPWLIATCAQTDDIATLHHIQQVQNGIKFNTVLPCGSLPLHICAKHNAIKCADLLLRISSNENSIVNEPDHVGFTALFYAVLQLNDTMIELLIRYGAKLTATLKPSEIGMYLCNCVKNNQVDRLKAWHKAGANLDQTDYDGRTPILLAVNYNSVDCVHYLLNNGNVDISWPDNRGMTPLQIAKQRGFDNIVQVLSSYASNS
ncbi:unnamed protein product [Rotaria magnacalcarata]|uniref:asparaginase n=1 Tax=Rotaria magnacalcarata TaxID=392030 RepID=A0A816V0E9_9BILA|nr:unnamed protein product [Rotaria magnacalcarata]CAF2117667.1 unnamed protein product [Rotaria magnacalcarata]